ncbi:MAG: choice-of-anchor A family protein, partial [Ignavibacteriales bacterium]|nr:choice-of-anchor A family protein [Ignavibacteriales bacterium]
QLTVSKSADKTSANDGEFINYTLTAKNIGTVLAQNVEVSDVLPSILDFISSTPSGVYNSLTGIWSVGTLAAGDSAQLVITTKVNYAHSASIPFNFGAAQDFNLFVIDTLRQPSADTQGKLAVGGYCDLSGYSVGDQLPPNSGNVLVCGDHLTFMVGRVYNGKAIYQNYITSTMGFSADDGIFQDSVINFPAAKLHLNNLSSQLAALNQTDTSARAYMQITLNGTRTGLNVFNLDGNQFLTSNGLTINAPAGSTVLVNISGDSTRLFGGFEVNGTTKDKVLLNFYEATKLLISGIDVRASVLAPKAALQFPAGLVSGQLMVRCMYGSGQVNLCPFTGVINNDTTITNFATIQNANVGNMPAFFVPTFGKAVVSASSLTSIKTFGTNTKPASFKLEQNYPNPFNPSTIIRFAVPQSGFVSVAVYNVNGELVNTLVNNEMSSGIHEVNFNAANLPSGVYICRMVSGSFSSVQKMILTK